MIARARLWLANRRLEKTLRPNPEFAVRSQRAKRGAVVAKEARRKRITDKLLADPMVSMVAEAGKRPNFTPGQKSAFRLALYQSGKKHCCYCGLHLQLADPHSKGYATIEHIIPKVIGGSDDLSNLDLCCQPCNVRQNEPFMNRITMVRKHLHALGYYERKARVPANV